MHIAGNVALGPGARFEAEIGGTGTAIGSGNYDRLWVKGNSALNVGRGTMHSLAASLGAGVSLPFTARAVDWRASAWASYIHELADTYASINARFLNTAFDQRRSAIGRDKMSAGWPFRVRFHNAPRSA